MLVSTIRLEPSLAPIISLLVRCLLFSFAGVLPMLQEDVQRSSQNSTIPHCDTWVVNREKSLYS